MFKPISIIFVYILVATCDENHEFLKSSNFSAIEDQILISSVDTLAIENIPFYKLGTYRGFTDDGTEYQKTYFISRYSVLPWAESISFCHSFNMEHLTFETQAEAQVYLNLLNSFWRTVSPVQFWIDGMSVDPKSKTEWFWAKTGKKISFPLSWHPANPFNYICLSLFKQNINDNFLFRGDECNSRKGASCQKIDLLIP